jgi:hypothetical protein
MPQRTAWLSDPNAILPVFGRPGLLFPATGMDIDPDAEAWRTLVADGTLVLDGPPVSPANADPATDAAGASQASRKTKE